MLVSLYELVCRTLPHSELNLGYSQDQSPYSEFSPYFYVPVQNVTNSNVCEVISLRLFSSCC